MLFLGAALLNSLTVLDNIALPIAKKHDLPPETISERMHLVLTEVGLTGVDNKNPDELSGVIEKRVGLARALIMQPKIILLDEPTTRLAPITDRAVHKLIKGTQDQFGYTVVIVSQDIPAFFSISVHLRAASRAPSCAWPSPGVR